MNPLLRNIAIAVGAPIVTVAIYFSSVIAPNYQGAILTHLADVINGQNTQTVVATNAPNWEMGIPVMSPIVSSVASSSNPTGAASGLASSTPYTFAVAALDGTGTTTIISTGQFTTDASTTQNKPENITIKWTPVNGATGYAVYFGTTTSPLTSGLNQYFMATTSGQYTFSTSTGSLAGSYTKADTTAFSEVLSPNSPDIFNDNIGSATSSPAASTTAVQINGTVDAIAGATTTACEADTAGVIFFNLTSHTEWGCNGTAWTKIF